MARHDEVTQVCLVTSALAAATLPAALDTGLLGPVERPRLLLVRGHAAAGVPGFERYGRVLDWSAEFRPLAPDGWMPRPAELPMLERWLLGRWGLDRCELVLDEVAAGPGRALAALLSDAPITVCSSTLEGYGPTPDLLPEGVGSRIERVLYLEFFPGLVPLLLHEYGIPYVPVPPEDVRGVLEGPGDPGGTAAAWIVAERGPLTRRAEIAVINDQARAIAARGFRRAVFGPGPAPGPAVRAAAAAGVRLTSFDGAPEPWSARNRPALTVGRASTELAVAGAVLGLPVAATGAPGLRTVPAALADGLLPRLLADGSVLPPAATPAELGPLLRAMAYAEQTGALPELRDDAVRYLGGLSARHRYFSPDRLAELDLPGPRAVGRVRRLLRSERT